MADRDWKSIALWVVTALLAAVLFFAGLQKFIDDGTWEADFVRWGYPAWFSLVIGVVEMAGAVALVIPLTSSYGAAVLAGNMLVAAITRATDGAWANFGGDLVFTALLVLIAYVRRPDWAQKWFPRQAVS